MEKRKIGIQSSRVFWILGLLVLLGLLAVTPVFAQGRGYTISGVVVAPLLSGTIGGEGQANVRVVLTTGDGAVRGEANTNAAGEFSFGPLLSGEYRLRAYPPAASPFAASHARLVILRNENIENLWLPLTHPIIRGTVYDPTGAPHAAEVHIYDAWGRQVQILPTLDGEFKIGGLRLGGSAGLPGDLPYVLAARPWGADNLWWSLPVTVTIPAMFNPITDAPQVQDLYLRWANLFGRVTDPEGAPVRGAKVLAYNLPVAGVVPQQETMPSDLMRRVDYTDQRGRFAIGGLLTGTYWVGIEPPWGQTSLISPPPLTITVPPPTHSLDLAFLTSPKVVQGSVADNLGNPIDAGARVVAVRVGRSGYAEVEVVAGSYQLPLAAGVWALTLRPTEYPGGTASWIYPWAPQLIRFRDDMTSEEKTVDFTVITLDASVSGRIEPADVPSAIELRTAQGIGHVWPTIDGTFAISVPHGLYRVWVHALDAYWLGPEVPPIQVPPAGSYVFTAPLQLLARNALITGTVSDESEVGLDGISVLGQRLDGRGWAHTRSTNGDYELPVAAGQWQVMPQHYYAYPPPTASYDPSNVYIYAGAPADVEVTDGGIVPSVNFTMTWADETIGGAVVNEEGHVLRDAVGVVIARHTGNPLLTAQAPINAGIFRLFVPGGDYSVRAHLPSDSSYIAGEAIVVSSGDRDVRLTLYQKNARIIGALWDADRDMAVTGEPATVVAWTPRAWQRGPIDPATGLYALDVTDGIWHLDYQLLDEESDYVPLRRRGNVPVQRPAPGQTTEVVVPLLVARRSATITGRTLDPDGAPLSGVRVFARGAGERNREIRLHTNSNEAGNYVLRVPSGVYHVGAALPPDKVESGWLAPGEARVEVTTTVTVDLQFRLADATISGLATIEGDVTPEHPIFVWAWSEDGGYARTLAALTDGAYALNVTAGDWHVGAAYADRATGHFYATRVDVTAPGEQDLVLTDRGVLPVPVSFSFAADEEQFIELFDGTSVMIPAGAMPVTGTVTLHIIPIVTLPSQRHARVVSYGYSFVAIDSEGNPIEEKFNQNVAISFSYTDEDLYEWGVREERLVPAYFSTTTSRWTLPESYAVDMENNRIVMQIDHFTDFGMVSTPEAETQQEVPALSGWGIALIVGMLAALLGRQFRRRG